MSSNPKISKNTKQTKVPNSKHTVTKQFYAGHILIVKRNENICPHKNLYTNVCNIIHNNQKMETIQISAPASEWVNNQGPYSSGK